MKKNLLLDLVLPSFWLFFFIVSPDAKSDYNTIIKKKNITKELNNKPDVLTTDTYDQLNINNTTTFINASYFYRF